MIAEPDNSFSDPAVLICAGMDQFNSMYNDGRLVDADPDAVYDFVDNAAANPLVAIAAAGGDPQEAALDPESASVGVREGLLGDYYKSLAQLQQVSYDLADEETLAAGTRRIQSEASRLSVPVASVMDASANALLGLPFSYDRMLFDYYSK